MGLDDDDLWATYATDTAQVLRSIEQSMLALENDPGDKKGLARLYRALHTLKGQSALLDLQRIERLAHAAEDLVGMVRDRGVALDGATMELLLAIAATLAEAVPQAWSERRDAEVAQVAELIARVEAWTAREGVLNVSLDLRKVGRPQLVIWSNAPPAEPVTSRATPANDGTRSEATDDTEGRTRRQ